MKWKCEIRSRGKTCRYEVYECLGCKQKNLKVALQELKWSLPFGIGKFFRTHEHKVECNEWRRW